MVSRTEAKIEAREYASTLNPGGWPTVWLIQPGLLFSAPLRWLRLQLEASCPTQHTGDCRVSLLSRPAFSLSVKKHQGKITLSFLNVGVQFNSRRETPTNDILREFVFSSPNEWLYLEKISDFFHTDSFPILRFLHWQLTRETRNAQLYLIHIGTF